MLSSLHSFDDLNLNLANEISYYTQIYHGLAAYEITEVIIDFITSVSVPSKGFFLAILFISVRNWFEK